MKATVENAKLLATLLAVIQKENSAAKDKLYEQLYASLQESIEQEIEESSGIRLLEVDGLDEPVPVRVFRGEQGEQGLIGEQGEIGPAGPQGDAGPQGERGLVGLQGERGFVGIQGDTGPQGEQGKQGIQGRKGDRGAVGPAGPQGIEGPRGAVGPTGLQGLQGETGPQGEKGRDGQDFESADLEKKFTKLYDEFVAKISSQMTRMAYARGGMDMSSGGGSGEVRLEFLDDVNRDSAKRDGYYLRWDSTSGKWLGDAANTFTTTIVTRDIIPETTNTYSLGTVDRNWKELHLSGNTIFLGGVAISADPVAETLKIGVNGKAQVLVTNGYITSTYITNTAARAFVLDEVAKVVNAAPTTLNTLVEIADALGDDANFANTLTTTIATKTSNAYVQTLLSNTNAYIASVDNTRNLNLSNTNARFATVEGTFATNTYAKSIGISSAAFTQANNTITFTRPDASEIKLQINASGGGSGNGDVSNGYLTSTFTTNTEFQRVLSNTNAYIASVVLSGNTTSISDANNSSGSSLISTNINSEVTFKKIRAGRNLEIVETSNSIILTAIPQKDYGFLSDDYGSIGNSSEGTVDYGTL